MSLLTSELDRPISSSSLTTTAPTHIHSRGSLLLFHPGGHLPSHCGVLGMEEGRGP